jgi:hypothetical protein
VYNKCKNDKSNQEIVFYDIFSKVIRQEVVLKRKIRDIQPMEIEKV